MRKTKIIAIVGPSSSGKTGLAIELAKELDGEIISVDSRQIYKELDIGSAKPTKIEQKGIKHHLIDIIDVNQEYTVADFNDAAKQKILEIESKGKIPILAGGTGLYFRVLLQDFDLPRVAPNKELRMELEQKSTEELYEELKQIDFDISEKIHVNNKVKIIRALEVCKTLGVPMSKAQKKKNNDYETLWFGLNSENREYLYSRINKRVDDMFDKGLLLEAINLFDKYGKNKILMGTIGYQELFPYINGQSDLETAVNLLKQNTRRYAKRQISWFKANKEIKWFDIETQTQKSILEEILKIL